MLLFDWMMSRRQRGNSWKKKQDENLSMLKRVDASSATMILSFSRQLEPFFELIGIIFFV